LNESIKSFIQIRRSQKFAGISHGTWRKESPARSIRLHEGVIEIGELARIVQSRWGNVVSAL